MAASKHRRVYARCPRDRAESLRHDLTEIVIDLERVYERLDVRPEELSEPIHVNGYLDVAG